MDGPFPPRGSHQPIHACFRVSELRDIDLDRFFRPHIEIGLSFVKNPYPETSVYYQRRADSDRYYEDILPRQYQIGRFLGQLHGREIVIKADYNTYLEDGVLHFYGPSCRTCCELDAEFQELRLTESSRFLGELLFRSLCSSWVKN